jgi:phage N-6-adenine-methyltransferase
MSARRISIVRTTPMPRRGGRQDWRTPQQLLRAVQRLLGIGGFVVDLASSPRNAVAPRFYTRATNGLAHSWKEQGWCWCNPPFADIAPWVAKAVREARRGAYIVFLVPASVGANWWDEHVHGKARVLFLNGRVRFVGADQGYMKDCALLMYAPRQRAGYHTWRWQSNAAPSRLQRAA